MEINKVDDCQNYMNNMNSSNKKISDEMIKMKKNMETLKKQQDLEEQSTSTKDYRTIIESTINNPISKRIVLM